MVARCCQPTFYITLFSLFIQASFEDLNMAYFANRVEAGKRLASELESFVGKNAIILAIPRGGVVVGYEIAKEFNLYLDVIIPRKIGAPDNPELAIGAMTEDGTIILDQKLVAYLGVSQDYIKEESERQKNEIKRRLKLYRGNDPYPDFHGQNVILVDDGIATGSTMKAALASVKNRGARTVTVAVPVGPPSTINELKKQADKVVCPYTPEYFEAIGQFYVNFDQTSDQEVIQLLKERKQKNPSRTIGMVTT